MKFYLCFRLIPESPRWLLSKNRVEEAKQAFEKIAEVNGKKAPLDLHQTLKKLADENEAKDESIFSYIIICDLFRYPSLRNRSFILIIT